MKISGKVFKIIFRPKHKRYVPSPLVNMNFISNALIVPIIFKIIAIVQIVFLHKII